MPEIESQILPPAVVELPSGQETEFYAKDRAVGTDKAIFLLAGEIFDHIYGAEERAAIAAG